ncbi:antibiotic biosynthesis monooxygenase [Pseudoalteromonas sp. NEC-BIFX-2020_015]|uniref:putative quinol monooxygenase n=1 Tax=Pseudoalteromonas sp. NEC-BIFX-2020_015 TaxID=2729544 RepID=UPI0014614EDA|nr:putative quinol monooxygenase [Pseudoalteromonas sp. NEC-BIFX-2020_015]NMR26139.1 antibiotic biosynthesis monooxygenase [Pseudoalteromonas sp. NEC-BIFX-2020_015]
MINIVAKITPNAALFTECKGRLQQMLQPTLAEPGCIRFELYEDLDQQCLFLIEKFASQDALDEHYQQPYVKEVFAFYESALALPVEINKLHMI